MDRTLFAGVRRTHAESADRTAQALALAAKDLKPIKVGVAAIRAILRLFEPFHKAIMVEMVPTLCLDSGIGF